jgi:DNA or RNA helicases of superfamily II
MLKAGLYEQVINEQLETDLQNEQDRLTKKTASIDDAESSKVLAEYIAEVVENAMNHLKGNKNDLSVKISLANKIIGTIKSEVSEDDFSEMSVSDRAEQLLAVIEKENSISAFNEKFDLDRPDSSIARSTLFTGAIHEPQLFTEMKKEIASCNKIDFLVSFVKWSGLRLIIEELRSFTERGGELRVITTSYMGATDLKAIEQLRTLPNTRIKVNYDTKRTRLHAKAYVFYRDTGFTVAYVGSSNLSNVAVSSGLEWNVKIARKDMPETIDKIEATFDSYWNSSEFEYYDEGQHDRLKRALQSEQHRDREANNIFPFDIRPYSYQQEILDRLQAERVVHHKYHNLVVAATGTGKTVIAAFDYLQYRKDNPQSACRLLFIAHREEILKQSLMTFRGIIKDNNFGGMMAGGIAADNLDHLFISIQSFNAKDFTEKTSSDFYDYIIVDEFHHAAAPSYQTLLEYYKPKVLLGLTATPERMDGKNILEYFDNRIAAEIRLPEAIDRKLLCPFQYFGVSDTTDLDELKWTRGGYDIGELSNVYTLNAYGAEKRANMIIAALNKYITDWDELKGLGFCVSVKHAQFMADHFHKSGIPAIALTGESPEELRKNAKSELEKGNIQFIFTVDLYNEGVDIPAVNTVMFLRPTESLTVFLQQLGRGLRLAEGKECLTVLDFIGQANNKYNFEEKFAALLSNTKVSVEKEIKRGFVSVPKGCYIKLEKIAQEHVLKNIKASFSNMSGIISRIRTFEEDSGRALTLSDFISYYNIGLQKIYKTRKSFSRLCVDADVRPNFDDIDEDVITKALPKLAAADSRCFIEFINSLLNSDEMPALSDGQKRMFQMLHMTIWQNPIEEICPDSFESEISRLRDNNTLCAEIIEELSYNEDHIDFIDEPVDLGFDCPLALHCSYYRDQILAAMDITTPIREGVRYISAKNIDVFFITLDKAEKDYSPTTMYQDYSIDEYLFHWQSQSTTSETSNTGNRYIEGTSTVLLFLREHKKDPETNMAEPYTFLGKAQYVSHKGSKPMSIIWRLDKPIPAKFLKKTSRLIVG